MTSVLNVDTIADKAGTGPVGLTKQHAAKAWVNFSGTGTPAFRDSFGASSLSDDSTGNYTVTLTNSMSTTTDWSGAISGNGAGYTHSFGGTSGAFTATTFPVNVRAAASSDTDISLLCGQVFGDLA